MHRSKKQQHFLAYTIEHILGAFFVFAVAMFLGYGAYAADTTIVSTTTLSTTIPGAYILTPPVLSVMSVMPGKVELSWVGVVVGSSAQGFAVYRNDQNISNLTVSSYTDSSGLTPGATYVYYIKTIDTAGNASVSSNIVTVTIPLSTTTGSSGASITTTTIVSTSTNSSTIGVSPSAATPPPVVSVTTTQPAVSFDVTVAPITDCSNGKPMTEVFFVVSNPLGGAFELSSNSGIKNAPLEWGRYPFANGTYSWKAVAKTGYTISGKNTDSFTLAGVCTTAVVATGTTVSVTTSAVGGTPTATADAFPLKYPENGNIVPIVSIDNVHIKEGDIVSGVVTLDVVAKGSTRSVFVLENKTGTKQFIDKQLGVVHKDGTDEWSILWNTANMGNDDYSLSVLMDTSAGTMISKKFSFAVNNSSLPASSQSGVLAIKKPVLKMYLSNSALLSGATVSLGEQVEFRVGATGAKKVSFYAIVPTAGSPMDIGQGVIDDLLSGKTQDIWTATFDTSKTKEGSYKVFARVLSLDGTVAESVPLPITVASNTSSMTTLSVSSASDTNTQLTLDARKEILQRITDPSQCNTKDECKVFCDSHGALPQCLIYVRTVLPQGDQNVSLASDISIENLSRVLIDTHKRSDIPDLVKSADDFVKFCADPSQADLCRKMLTKNDLATNATLDTQEAKLLAVKDIEAKRLTERVGARSFIDTDGDGISDYDEINIYHTDYNDADTDHDGVPDGAEIVNHTNPHGDEPIAVQGTTSVAVSSVIDEGVKFEDPLIAGVEKKAMLAVSNVQVAEVGTNAAGETTAKKLLLSGTALPNSFVTLYVFSTPIVVTVKADSSGAWVYTLDKELPNGSHQVVSAITDEGGHILAKSETLPFVKVAAAVSVGSNALLPSNETPGFFTGASLYAFIAILIGLIGVAFSIIGFAVRTRSEKDVPLFPPTAK